MAIWIFGTSVSALRAGWVRRLETSTTEAINNLSIGDQTSVMGLARLSQVVHRIRPGDIVIWEYPLLDILLRSFDDLDIFHAMRQAWHMARSAGAPVIVLFFTPKRDLAEPSPFEQRITAAAADAADALVDLRDCFPAGDDPSRHYSDGRHIHVDSPVLDVIAAAVERAIAACRGCRMAPLPPYTEPFWTWWDAKDLGVSQVQRLQSWLVSVETARLAPEREGLALPPHRRLICVVVASDAESGALWCGHASCFPASCRMPESLMRYKFLLRITRIPCVRRSIATLRAAPPYALTRGSWWDYGLAETSEPRPVEIAGVLLEGAPPR